MNKLFILIASVLLIGCQTPQQEENAELAPTLDPGARQIMMEEEAQMPTEEEGIIPAPSDMIRMY